MLGRVGTVGLEVSGREFQEQSAYSWGAGRTPCPAVTARDWWSQLCSGALPALPLWARNKMTSAGSTVLRL